MKTSCAQLAGELLTLSRDPDTSPTRSKILKEAAKVVANYPNPVFRYYTTNNAGCVEGTNVLNTACRQARLANTLVLDAATGVRLMPDRTRVRVHNLDTAI